jgi:hypothetical protein
MQELSGEASVAKFTRFTRLDQCAALVVGLLAPFGRSLRDGLHVKKVGVSLCLVGGIGAEPELSARVSWTQPRWKDRHYRIYCCPKQALIALLRVRCVRGLHPHPGRLRGRQHELQHTDQPRVPCYDSICKAAIELSKHLREVANLGVSGSCCRVKGADIFIVCHPHLED